jgi:hypothetical protein
MVATRYNLVISCGADFFFTFRIADVNQNPVALTGGSSAFRAQIREVSSSRLAAAFTITVVDGELKFSLTPNQTLQLQPKTNYEWDFFWTDTAGTVRRLLFGSVEAQRNITHMP